MSRIVKEIPEEIRADVKEVTLRCKGRLYPKIADLRYLMTVYYRYIGNVGNMTVEDKVKKQIKCGTCRSTVLKHFSKAIINW